MRQLQFVGVSDDGAHLMLQDAANVREQFLLPIDDRLRAASRGDRSRLGQIELELESTLRPREIQARIRAGESPEEVAAAAGAPLQRVMRFAYPVLQEREQVTVEARRTRIRRSDGALQLGEQVDDRLTRQGIDPDTAGWDACRREDGSWWLSLSWMAGKTPRRAQWSFDLAGRTLTPADDLAAELQAEQPRRRQIAAVPFVPADEPEDSDDQTARPGAERDQPARREQRTVSRPVRLGRTDHPAGRARAESPRPAAVRPETPARQQAPTRQQPPAPQQPPTAQQSRQQSPTPAPPARPQPQPQPLASQQRPRTEPYGWAAPTAASATPSAEQTARAEDATKADVPKDDVTTGELSTAAGSGAKTEPRPAQPVAADDKPIRAATEPPPPSTQDSENEPPAKPAKGRKPKVPSWDDIVFGTRGHR